MKSEEFVIIFFVPITGGILHRFLETLILAVKKPMLHRPFPALIKFYYSRKLIALNT
jgi:hypothetical protein